MPDWTDRMVAKLSSAMPMMISGTMIGATK
jgi:hypothetical protein